MTAKKPKDCKWENPAPAVMRDMPAAHAWLRQKGFCGENIIAFGESLGGGADDAQNAADNACLYLIWDRQGQAEAALVIEGNPKLFDIHGGILGAEEHDETITFSGKIVSVRE